MRSQHNPLRKFLTFSLFFFVALALSAAGDVISPEDEMADAQEQAPLPASLDGGKAVADSLYAAGAFKQAAEHYAALADSTMSTDIYYNLGNAEYKQKHYAKAVLAYERALWIDADNEDAQYNISLVRTRLTDRFSKPSEMFFISWFRTWISSHSVAHWTKLSFAWLAVFFAFLILYFVGSRIWLRKTGFFLAIFCFVCFLTTSAFAAVQRYNYYNNTDAVILADETTLYASPSESSKNLQTLHEGTTVTLDDMHEKGWVLVTLPDGRTGWLKDTGYEMVAKF